MLGKWKPFYAKMDAFVFFSGVKQGQISTEWVTYLKFTKHIGHLWSSSWALPSNQSIHCIFFVIRRGNIRKKIQGPNFQWDLNSCPSYLLSNFDHLRRHHSPNWAETCLGFVAWCPLALALVKWATTWVVGSNPVDESCCFTTAAKSSSTQWHFLLLFVT